MPGLAAAARYTTRRELVSARRRTGCAAIVSELLVCDAIQPALGRAARGVERRSRRERGGEGLRHQVGRQLAGASRPGSPHSGELELTEPRLRGTTVGEDPNGGIARVRVSISERISCRGDDGTRFERLRARYFPPPQIEQIRAAPGAGLPTHGKRSRLLSLAGERCGANAEATEVHGKLWGEVINGHGLETFTPPVRFRYSS